MIHKEDCFCATCDNCGEIFEDGEYSLYSLESDVKEAMQNHEEWYCGDTDKDHLGKHYCFDCFKWHPEIDDKIILDTTRTKPVASPTKDAPGSNPYCSCGDPSCEKHTPSSLPPAMQGISAEEVLDKWLCNYPWQYSAKENALKAMEEHRSVPAPISGEGLYRFIEIDYKNIPKGEVLLLTTSKTILKGDWYKNNFDKKEGWRTERSVWQFYRPDGVEQLTLTPKEEVTHYCLLPNIEPLPPNEREGKMFSVEDMEALIAFIGKEDLKQYAEGWCQPGGSNGFHWSSKELLQNFISSLNKK